MLHTSAVVALAARTDQYLHLSSVFWRARLRDVGGGDRLRSQTLLLSPLCFHCCQEGSVIKLPFLCLCLWLYLQWAGCSPPAGAGGGGSLWAHERLFYTRLQEGQIQEKNQWGNGSAASNSISASQDPLRGIGISRAPNGRIINMTDRGMRKEDGGERAGEILLVGNVRRAGVFSRQHSAEFYLLHETPSPESSFTFTYFHHKNSDGSFLPNVGGFHTCADVQRAWAL